MRYQTYQKLCLVIDLYGKKAPFEQFPQDVAAYPLPSLQRGFTNCGRGDRPDQLLHFAP